MTIFRDPNQEHGVLLLEMLPESRLEDWQLRLLETVAQHIATAITLAERDSESRRLVLLRWSPRAESNR